MLFIVKELFEPERHEEPVFSTGLGVHWRVTTCKWNTPRIIGREDFKTPSVALGTSCELLDRVGWGFYKHTALMGSQCHQIANKLQSSRPS